MPHGDTVIRDHASRPQSGSGAAMQGDPERSLSFWWQVLKRQQAPLIQRDLGVGEQAVQVLRDNGSPSAAYQALALALRCPTFKMEAHARW